MAISDKGYIKLRCDTAKDKWKPVLMTFYCMSQISGEETVTLTFRCLACKGTHYRKIHENLYFNNTRTELLELLSEGK